MNKYFAGLTFPFNSISDLFFFFFNFYSSNTGQQTTTHMKVFLFGWALGLHEPKKKNDDYAMSYDSHGILRIMHTHTHKHTEVCALVHTLAGIHQKFLLYGDDFKHMLQ